MSQMPVKFRILQAINQNKELSNQELLEILKKEYPLDRCVNGEGIDNCLLSLKTGGMIKLTQAVEDSNGKLKLYYKITDYGMNRMKYIY
ncbi:hypothetical protein ACHOLT_19740 [Desulfitobacterium sp. Sab5]|uniref:hypothetical protein n=1 Tax=Desulfitobacterium nosdiversum TaxID=3375356 RepID=UPI003CE951A6